MVQLGAARRVGRADHGLASASCVALAVAVWGACRFFAGPRARLVRVPQKYSPAEDNLVLRKGTRKIIFTLTKGKVTEISTGRTPEINLVERCS